MKLSWVSITNFFRGALFTFLLWIAWRIPAPILFLFVVLALLIHMRVQRSEIIKPPLHHPEPSQSELLAPQDSPALENRRLQKSTSYLASHNQLLERHTTNQSHFHAILKRFNHILEKVAESFEYQLSTDAAVSFDDDFYCKRLEADEALVALEKKVDALSSRLQPSNIKGQLEEKDFEGFIQEIMQSEEDIQVLENQIVVMERVLEEHGKQQQGAASLRLIQFPQ